MRPLALIVFVAAGGTIIWTLFGGTISPVISLVIYGVSALLIVVYFNYLRKHATERDTIWLATGIFVGIVNIFISLLNVFSSR
jgi:modulator of FtsH protease